MATRYDHYKQAEALLEKEKPDAKDIEMAKVHAQLANVERHVAGD